LSEPTCELSLVPVQLSPPSEVTMGARLQHPAASNSSRSVFAEPRESSVTSPREATLDHQKCCEAFRTSTSDARKQLLLDCGLFPAPQGTTPRVLHRRWSHLFLLLPRPPSPRHHVLSASCGCRGSRRCCTLVPPPSFGPLCELGGRRLGQVDGACQEGVEGG